MTIDIDKDGNIKWRFHRKSYRKARWKRVGQRMINEMQKNYPGFTCMIIVI